MVKNPPGNARDTREVGSISELGRTPGERNGNPLQYSCLENPMDREPGGLESMGSQSVCTHTGIASDSRPSTPYMDDLS